jgi:hypothetical protein
MERRRADHERSVPWPPVRRPRTGTAAETEGGAADVHGTVTPDAAGSAPAPASAHPSMGPAADPAQTASTSEGGHGAAGTALPDGDAARTAGGPSEQSATPSSSAEGTDEPRQDGGEGSPSGGHTDNGRPPAGGHLRALQN